MAKAVLISIRPEWVEKIVGGEKTIEVRKTRPKLETPFKCYIYETQGKSDTPWIDEDGHMIFRGRGKVVAEFTCTGIDKIEPANEPYGTYDIDDDYVLKNVPEKWGHVGLRQWADALRLEYFRCSYFLPVAYGT